MALDQANKNSRQWLMATMMRNQTKAFLGAPGAYELKEVSVAKSDSHLQSSTWEDKQFKVIFSYIMHLRPAGLEKDLVSKEEEESG